LPLLFSFRFLIVTHTAPIAFLLVDTLLTCHHAPDRRVGSLIVLLLFIFYLGMLVTDKYFKFMLFN